MPRYPGWLNTPCQGLETPVAADQPRVRHPIVPAPAVVAGEIWTEELADITGEDVLNAIGQLPEGEQLCAFLAAQTIQDAVTHFMNAGK